MHDAPLILFYGNCQAHAIMQIMEIGLQNTTASESYRVFSQMLLKKTNLRLLSKKRP